MADTPQLPTILLGGKEYAVKPLTIRQLRFVVPAMMRIGKANPHALTEANIDDMTEVIYQAICPALEKPLSRDEYLSIPADTTEMIAAMPVIAKQSGMVQKDEPQGEAVAGNLLIGTES